MKTINDRWNQYTFMPIHAWLQNGGPSADLDFPAPFPFISFGNNYPFRGAKSSFFDGGTKSPTIFFKPKMMRNCRGQKRDFLMHITDWIPTILDIVDPNYRPISRLSLLVIVNFRLFGFLLLMVSLITKLLCDRQHNPFSSLNAQSPPHPHRINGNINEINILLGKGMYHWSYLLVEWNTMILISA